MVVCKSGNRRAACPPAKINRAVCTCIKRSSGQILIFKILCTKPLQTRTGGYKISGGAKNRIVIGKTIVKSNRSTDSGESTQSTCHADRMIRVSIGTSSAGNITIPVGSDNSDLLYAVLIERQD